MTKKKQDIAASVAARLLSHARQRSEDYQLVLLRYANERLLYRLSKSPDAGRFVLKGAALFTLWTGHPHRATRDLDLLGFGDASVEGVRVSMTNILATEVEDDGLLFDADSLEVDTIRDDKAYGGVRAKLFANLNRSRIRLQIDVGFGDAVTPPAAQVEFPRLLPDFPAPVLRAYPRETVVAEKIEAMVSLGLANSRMKDFFDVTELARMFEFDGKLLATAIRATFARRGTALPNELPVALTSTFWDDATKKVQWSAFVNKAGLHSVVSLEAQSNELAAFIAEPLNAAASGTNWEATWAAGGPWVTRE